MYMYNIIKDIYSDEDINLFNNSLDNSSKQLISWEKQRIAREILILILSIIELPTILLTLYALYFLVKSRHNASVYVIHLILSDLIQIICMVLSTFNDTFILSSTYRYSLFVGVYFMSCIAFERYLLVSHPLWYRTHYSFKLSGLISLIIWFVPLTFSHIHRPYLHFYVQDEAVAFLIPYLIIIFCFVGTWRGLSRSISITSHKRRSILSSLFLVLLTYTFLILPQSVEYFFLMLNYNVDIYAKLFMFLECVLYLNPLADCLLYLFMRTDVGDVINSLHCCCKSDPVQISVRYTSRPNTQCHDV